MLFFLKNCIVIICLSLYTVATYGSSQLWEYSSKTIIIQSDSYTTKSINSYAKKGWELVDCEEAKGKLICIFKRPI